MDQPLIDHVGIRVSDLAASRAMYEAALAPLGWTTRQGAGTTDDAAGVAFLRDDRDDFYIQVTGGQPGQDMVTTGVHIAFAAASREQVDAFHAAAVANGGRDIGAPGVRERYGPGYYGGFVFDLDGNNIEAVYHPPA